MISRDAKMAFYFLAAPLMRFNALRHRVFARRNLSGMQKIHLGPGQQRYMPGWINIDANFYSGCCDVWADLRYPLPFNGSTVDAVYSHHVIEHLPNLSSHFKDVFRCMKSGAVYRVGGPNGDSAIKKFLVVVQMWML